MQGKKHRQADDGHERRGDYHQLLEEQVRSSLPAEAGPELLDVGNRVLRKEGAENEDALDDKVVELSAERVLFFVVVGAQRVLFVENGKLLQAAEAESDAEEAYDAVQNQSEKDSA